MRFSKGFLKSILTCQNNFHYTDCRVYQWMLFQSFINFGEVTFRKDQICLCWWPEGGKRQLWFTKSYFNPPMLLLWSKQSESQQFRNHTNIWITQSILSVFTTIRPKENCSFSSFVWSKLNKSFGYDCTSRASSFASVVNHLFSSFKRKLSFLSIWPSMIHIEAVAHHGGVNFNDGCMKLLLAFDKIEQIV